MLWQDAYIAAGFGESSFQDQTNLGLIGIGAVLACSAAAVVAPRRLALAPLIALASLVSTGQQVAILSLDFNLVRLLLIAYVIRIAARGEGRPNFFSRLDKVVLSWVLVSSLAYIILHGSTGKMVYQMGQVYDRLGTYLVCRLYLRSAPDLERAAKAFAVVSIPVGVAFLIERATGRNLFAALGGVPEITVVREGRLRCQGPYVHPILAGVYWVGVLPIVWGLLRSNRIMTRMLGVAGISSALIVLVTCSSSTPLIGLLAAMGVAVLWSQRRHFPALFLASLALLTVIHFAREQPVWQLISRAGVVGGSTAQHRYRLINAFMINWSEWFILGTKGTAHWGYYLFDVTNQYVKEGVRGGFLGIALFDWSLFLAHRELWRNTVRKGIPLAARRWAWSPFIALFSTSVMFIGVSITHANQNVLVFMFLLAAASTDYSVTTGRKRSASRHTTAAHRSPAA